MTAGGHPVARRGGYAPQGEGRVKSLGPLAVDRATPTQFFFAYFEGRYLELYGTCMRGLRLVAVGEHSAHHVIVDIDTESVRDDLRNR